MSDRVSTLKEKARRLVEGRKHAKAIPLFEKLGRLEPHNPRWPHKLGECFQRGSAKADEIPLDDAEHASEQPATDRLVEQMRDTPLFSSLDRQSLRALVDRVSVRVCEPGERIVLQGAPGDTLFILVDGEVTVYREGARPVPLGHLEEGAFFGEIALLTHLERSATVKATTDCTLLEISREIIADLVEGHPGVLPVLLRFFRERLIDTLVETHRLFTPFAGSDRRELVKRFSFIEAEPDCALLQAGEPADGLYLLLSGRAAVAPRRAPSAPEIYSERSPCSPASLRPWRCARPPSAGCSSWSGAPFAT